MINHFDHQSTRRQYAPLILRPLDCPRADKIMNELKHDTRMNVGLMCTKSRDSLDRAGITENRYTKQIMRLISQGTKTFYPTTVLTLRPIESERFRLYDVWVYSMQLQWKMEPDPVMLGDGYFNLYARL